MSEPLTAADGNHGPADPFINIDDLPEGDVAALEKALADPLPRTGFVADCQREIARPRCKECGEALGVRFVVDNGVTYCLRCASGEGA